MADMKHDVATKLLWVDLEMTGLEPETDKILEVAAIVTDFDFDELDSFTTAIHQPDDVLACMNEWCQTTHAASGLLKEVAVAPSEQHVVKDFVQFIERNFNNEPAVLAGNSIHQDRRFIRQWWPGVEALLHYRMLDVSSYKIIMQGKYHKVFGKKETHKALDDIKESIAELKFYLAK